MVVASKRRLGERPLLEGLQGFRLRTFEFKDNLRQCAPKICVPSLGPIQSDGRHHQFQPTGLQLVERLVPADVKHKFFNLGGSHPSPW